MGGPRQRPFFGPPFRYATLGDVTMQPAPKAANPRGLEGVVATTTAICRVEDNSLIYRGYPIEELATKAEYEEVAYLLLNGTCRASHSSAISRRS